MSDRPTLHVLGMPLVESHPLSASTVEILSRCSLILGENRKILLGYLKRNSVDMQNTQWLALDPPRKETWELLEQDLLEVSKQGGELALLSDVGMPILFDPGKAVLERCRELNFQIRCLPAATAWSTACALSGWDPPFLLQGYLTQKKQVRLSQMKELRRTNAHIVLMETPYRFLALMEQLIQVYGPSHEAFLAWEISSEQEHYEWGSLTHLLKEAQSSKRTKGEFVIILK